jgi:Holliday junction resolvase-like predicted endonuclease
MEDTYLEEIHRVEEEKQRKLQEEKQKYNVLSPEEKQKRCSTDCIITNGRARMGRRLGCRSIALTPNIFFKSGYAKGGHFLFSIEAMKLKSFINDARRKNYLK